MRNLVIALFLLSLFAFAMSLNASSVPQVENVYNPFTGRQDYIVDLSTDITTGGKIFLGGSTDTYFEFDGTTLSLYINGVLNTEWADGINRLLLESVVANALLLESGDFLLLETGEKVLLE